jgi:predicted aldo/keto reductase-like oxidoreductase
MPCPNGVDIPGNFLLMNFDRVYGMTEYARSNYAKLVNGDKVTIRGQRTIEGLPASECVQCGGCTNVCPACYCFLLSDEEYAEDAYERTRARDSCQFTGYSQMAGPPGTLAPDPRRNHMSKFQHRFAHKFWYNAVSPGILGCVGCGRCRDTCPGAIDLRRVLTEVSRQRVKNG